MVYVRAAGPVLLGPMGAIVVARFGVGPSRPRHSPSGPSCGRFSKRLTMMLLMGPRFAFNAIERQQILVRS